MTKGFSEKEREAIREKLIHSAEICWGKYGMKKTTVDELVAMANISKGSFYLFYESKEHLFMDTLNNMETQMKARIFEILQNIQGSKKELFISVITQMCMEVKKMPWILQFKTTDLELILRKLPHEELEKHIKQDDDSVVQLLNFLGVKTKIDINVISGAMRGVFLLLLHEDELGENNLDSIIQFYIEALAQKIFDEE